MLLNVLLIEKPIRLIICVLFVAQVVSAQSGFEHGVSLLRTMDIEEIQEHIDGLNLIEQKILSYWSQSNYTSLEPQRSISEMDTTLLSLNQKIIFFLAKGKESFNLLKSNDTLIFDYYFHAYTLSKESDSFQIRCEALKCVLKYFKGKLRNANLAVPYLEEFERVGYDDYENLTHLYFQFTFEMDFAFLNNSDKESASKSVVVVEEKRWQEAIDKSDSLGFAELTTSFIEARAVHSEIFLKDYSGAEYYYRDAIKRIAQLPQRRKGRNLLSIITNYSYFLKDNKKYKESIEFFNNVLNDNSIRKLEIDKYKIYGWLGEAYKGIEMYDSAYHYSDLARNSNALMQEREFDIDVFNTQRKYDFENLLKENALIGISNKKNAFLKWIFIISTIFTIILLILIALLLRFRTKTHKLRLQQKDKLMQIKSLQAELEGEYKERKRIALELHDSVSSSLTSLSTHLKVMELNQDEGETESLKKVKSILTMTNEQIRNLSHKLFPPALLKYGFSVAIENLCEQYSNRKLRIHCHLSNVPKGMNNGISSKIFQIIQELLKNVLVHSGASEACVRIDFEKLFCEMEVSDNGIGIHPETFDDNKGLGLYAMKKRLEEIGGDFTISNQYPSGTSIIIRIPSELFRTQ